MSLRLLARRASSFTYLVIALLLANGPAIAAEAESSAYEVRWADQAINVDGHADEAVWKVAASIDNFQMPWRKEGERSPNFKTNARLLWDREYLYILADLEDEDLVAGERASDARLTGNDTFELLLQPVQGSSAYYQFAVTPAATKLDMFIEDREPDAYERYAKARPFHWQIAVQARGTLDQRGDRDVGWTVEGRIPWIDLLATGGRPVPGTSWRFALARQELRADAVAEWSTNLAATTHDRPDFHYLEDFVPLDFRGPSAETATQPYGIAARTPLTTSRVVGSPDQPLPFHAVRVLPELKLDWPVFVIRQPNSRQLLLIDQLQNSGRSRVRRTSDNPAAGQLETLIDDGDLLYSICFHPSFAENGYFYVGSSGTRPGETPRCRITRYTMERQPPYAVDPTSALVIIEWESNGHNGAAIGFGNDGMMYITTGDGTSDSDTNVVGQGLEHLLAKVLRIDVDHPEDGRQYRVPLDNPFIDYPNARPETWAYGLRNPWRLSVDAATGNIWVGNNGQDLWEQIYLVERGANYGWSVYEGRHPFYLNRKLGPTPHRPPMFEHPHSEARSLTGGVVYSGRKHPELEGAYLYGDYSTGKIWGAEVDAQRRVEWHRELADTTLQITSFGLDADGELLITDHQGNGNGGLYTLELNPSPYNPDDFPRRLSESGLFQSVRGHVVQPGLIPYSVNSPLWSDGTHKERWIALPESAGTDGQPPQIDFQPRGAWGFPNGTVLVKSFALELREGDPASRRWIETRFLTRQQGEWVGYSYAWNEAQDDAELVEASGTDRTFDIDTAGGQRQQVWHYPSRAECMVCHSRAANYVLGPSTMQMNKRHDYGGIVDHQFRVLEHLGVLRVDWRTDAVEHFRTRLAAEGRIASEIDQTLAQVAAARQVVPASTSTLLVRAHEQYDRLADPYDEREPVAERARSYLQSNCAHCHVEAGGGNAQFNAAYATALEAMKLIDVRPVHHTFGISDARLIAPGEPDRSVLLHRLRIREAGQMPQLGTSIADKQAVNLIERWIREMPPAPQATPPSPEP